MSTWSTLSRIIGCLSFAAILTVSPATDLLAQAQIDVTSLLVRYRTLKRVKNPTGEQLKALEEVERQAQPLYLAGKTGEVRRLLYKSYALLENREWTKRDEFSSSLVLRTDSTVCDSGQTIIARIGQIYPAEEESSAPLNVHVSLSIPQRRGRTITAGQERSDLGSYSVLTRDFLDTPFSFPVDLGKVPEGTYALTASVQLGDEPMCQLSTPLFVVKDLTGLKANFSKRLERLQAKDGTVASLLYPFDLAMSLNLGRFQARPAHDFRTMLQESSRLLEELEKGGDPLYGATGDHNRHYRFTEAGEIMPYRLFVPSTYDGSRPFPLIMVLHGLGGTQDTFFENNGGQLLTLCEQNGYILVSPLGYRPNGGYGRGRMLPLAELRQMSELSEKDVMNVLDLVRKEYKVDEKRIYLTGHSMGGNGTWSLASRYPELWAAVAPSAAGGVLPSNLDLAAMSHIPVLVIHGDSDMTAPVDASREMVRAMKELGMTHEYIEVPGGTHGSVVRPNQTKIIEFFNQHRKQ